MAKEKKLKKKYDRPKWWQWTRDLVKQQHLPVDSEGNPICDECGTAIAPEDLSIDHIEEWQDIRAVLENNEMRALGIDPALHPEMYKNLERSLFNDMPFPPTTDKAELRAIAAKEGGPEELRDSHPAHGRNLQLLHTSCNQKKSREKDQRDEEIAAFRKERKTGKPRDKGYWVDKASKYSNASDLHI